MLSMVIGAMLFMNIRYPPVRIQFDYSVCRRRPLGGKNYRHHRTFFLMEFDRSCKIDIGQDVTVNHYQCLPDIFLGMPDGSGSPKRARFSNVLELYASFQPIAEDVLDLV